MIVVSLLMAASASRLVPLTNPGLWVTDDDYPPVAMREGIEGATAFRLDISATGLVEKCTVVVSSGSAILDDATCLLVRERARFAPGRDRKGRAIGGTFQSRIRWQISKPFNTKFFPRVPFNSIIRLEVDQTGTTVDCVYTGPLPTDQAVRLCEAAKSAQAVDPFTDKSGKPVAKIITLRSSATIEDK